jgi:hypothetical protein
MKNSEMLVWAKEYASRGWWVFPLHSIDSDGNCTCGKCGSEGDAGKHPAIDRGLKRASRDLSILESWWNDNSPLRNIGLVTGEISGITVIDIDVGVGKLGAETWADLIREHGEPETLMAETGSGGMHVVFKYGSSLKTSSNTLGKGVDCRNDNGYIVATPSLHRSGGSYSWLNWGDSVELAYLPAHLSKKVENRGRPRGDGKGSSEKRKKYSLEQVEAMLEVVDSRDRDLWRLVGIILGREFKQSDAAWDLYNRWADKAGVKKGRNHDEIMNEAFYIISGQNAERELSIGTIVKLAVSNGWAPQKGEVPIENFVYFGPGNNFIYRPTISYWIASAVDAAVSPINTDGKITSASEWLKQNQLATSLTSDPSQDSDYLKGYDCQKGEIIESTGAAMYNTYRKPNIHLGDHRLAQPFVSHVEKVFSKPGDAKQFLDYMAHRVQKPWEKPRFALMIAGGQGVGKDTAIEMCVPAIGSWNVANIDPSAFESSFNEFAAATLVRISEAANLHEMSKWAFNERTKVLIAGTPDIMDINPKYGQKFVVKMYCGVIITTNHLVSGIYIPSDDRRYDVIESATIQEMGLTDEDEKAAYFTDLWEWFFTGGMNHIAAYLHERDVSGFSANNGQRKTDAHKMVVAGSMASDQWLMDAIEHFGENDLIRSDWLLTKVCEDGSKVEAMKPRLNAAISRLGYVIYRNPDRKDGRWRLEAKNVTIFAKSGTPMVDCLDGSNRNAMLPDYIRMEKF